MQPLPYFTIVDRYFIRNLLVITLMCLISVVGVMLLFDMLQRADSIPDLFRKYSTWGALEILGKYYLIRVLCICKVAGIYLIISGLTITFYRMERDTTSTTRGGEVIPMLTSGFSRLRVSIPFFYTSIFLVMFLTVAVEIFFPTCKEWPGANSASYTPEKSAKIEERLDPTTGFVFSGESLNLDLQQIIQPILLFPSVANGISYDPLSAELAQWVAPADDHPGGYVFQNVKNKDQTDWIPSLPADQSPFTEKIFRTAGISWLPEGEIFVASEIQPEYMRSNARMFVPISIRELYRRLHEPSDSFQLPERVELHFRLLKPLLDISLIFLTVPIILSARFRSKMIIAFLLGAVFLVFQLFPMFCIQLGERGVVSPHFAAWIPLFVFYTFAAFLFEELYT